MNFIDLAYLAGLIDGEGSIIVHRQQRKGQKSVRFYPTIHIYNTNKPVLEWIANTFGGSLHLNRKAGTRSKIAFKKDVWNYSISANKARPLLESLLPFLKIKKDHALGALALPTYDYHTGALKSWEVRRLKYGPDGGTAKGWITRRSRP